MYNFSNRYFLKCAVFLDLFSSSVITHHVFYNSMTSGFFVAIKSTESITSIYASINCNVGVLRC